MTTYPMNDNYNWCSYQSIAKACCIYIASNGNQRKQIYADALYDQARAKRHIEFKKRGCNGR